MELKKIIDLLKYLFLLGFISTGYFIIIHPNKQLLWFLSVYLLYFFISSVFLSHSIENGLERKEIMKGIIKILLGTLVIYLIYYNLAKVINLLFVADHFKYNNELNATNVSYASFFFIGKFSKFSYKHLLKK